MERREAGQPAPQQELAGSPNTGLPELPAATAEAVLKAVDAVFSKQPATEGLIFDEASVIKHSAFRTGQAGLVELWPVVAETKPEPAEAFQPWNEDAAPPHAVDVLCGRIAGQIKAWLDKKEELESAGRKITPGDIDTTDRARALT